jgi:hypothetical protein
MTVEAGETVFIFADAFYGPVDTDGDGEADVVQAMGNGPYTLSVTPATAPVLTEASATFDRAREFLAVRASWTDGEGDVV